MKPEPNPLWHAQADMHRIDCARRVITRGEGAYVWSADGHRALDLPAGLWFCAVGHGRGEIVDAVASQMRQLASYSNFQQYATAPALELAERLAALAPLSGAKVMLTSNGSDAVDAAAKLARRYWSAVGRPGKRCLVARSSGYHGLHGFGTGLGGIERNREGLDEVIKGITHVPYDDADAFEVLLENAGDAIAAFFCEPVMGTGGVLLPPDGYLKRVQAACRRHDVLFVVDEVITGFGRTGSLFACERFGLRPDIMLFAKCVTSGYMPLGGMLVGERVAEPFWSQEKPLVFRHGLTYQGHAGSCAAALANLEILEREGLVDRGRSLEHALKTAFGQLDRDPSVLAVRSGVGLMAGIELVDARTAARVVDRCWELGVVTRLLGDGRVLHVSPAFVIEKAELFDAAALMAEAIAAVRPETPAPA